MLLSESPSWNPSQIVKCLLKWQSPLAQKHWGCSLNHLNLWSLRSTETSWPQWSILSQNPWFFIAQHEAIFSWWMLTSKFCRKKEGVKPKISYRTVGRKAEPRFTYEANPDLGLQNAMPLFQGNGDFQTACSCVTEEGVKWTHLLLLGFKVGPFFLLHWKICVAWKLKLIWG